jgi:hypothetical protein
MTKTTKRNSKTGRSVIETYIREIDLYRIDDYFDGKGIKTNHVIRHDDSNRVENQILNKDGKVIKTKRWEPEEIFDFEKDLDEPYPYNKFKCHKRCNLFDL